MINKRKNTLNEMAAIKRSAAATLERLLTRYLAAESRRGCSTSVNKTESPSPETVLSTKNRESCVRKLRLYPATKMNEKAREAAVLVPLCKCRGQLGLLYTLRSSKLNSNGGQVSFPGGMKDETDESLEQTALRETWEELRIPPSKIDAWSVVNSVGRKNLSVTPVFGYVGEIDPEKLEINHHEVEEAFVISLEKLCDPTHFRFTRFRTGISMPVYTGGKYRVWGLTAGITHMIMSALVPDFYKNKLRITLSVENTKESISVENQR